MNSFLRKLRWSVGRDRKEAEARGLTEEQARSAARRELGNLALLMEDTRAGGIPAGPPRPARGSHGGLAVRLAVH